MSLGVSGIRTLASRIPRHSARRATALVAAVLLLAGCGSRTYYTPEIAGVVLSTGSADAGLTRFNLIDGRSFTANELDGATVVYRAGEAVGDLLLGGTGPDGPWVALLAPATLTRSDLPAGCYALNGYGSDDGDWILMDVGLRLGKAPGFDPGLLPDTPDGPVPTAHPGLRYDGVGQTFCLNSEGMVKARR